MWLSILGIVQEVEEPDSPLDPIEVVVPRTYGPCECGCPYAYHGGRGPNRGRCGDCGRCRAYVEGSATLQLGGHTPVQSRRQIDALHQGELRNQVTFSAMARVVEMVPETPLTNVVISNTTTGTTYTYETPVSVVEDDMDREVEG